MWSWIKSVNWKVDIGQNNTEILFWLYSYFVISGLDWIGLDWDGLDWVGLDLQVGEV